MVKSSAPTPSPSSRPRDPRALACLARRCTGIRDRRSSTSIAPDPNPSPHLQTETDENMTMPLEDKGTGARADKEDQPSNPTAVSAAVGEKRGLAEMEAGGAAGHSEGGGAEEADPVMTELCKLAAKRERETAGLLLALLADLTLEQITAIKAGHARFDQSAPAFTALERAFIGDLLCEYYELEARKCFNAAKADFDLHMAEQAAVQGSFKKTQELAGSETSNMTQSYAFKDEAVSWLRTSKDAVAELQQMEAAAE